MSVDPAYPKELFEKVLAYIPIMRHGRIIHCIFVDDMKLKEPHVRLEAPRDDLFSHYLEQRWAFDFEDNFTPKDAIRILRQAASIYGLKVIKSQTTTYGIPRSYYSITSKDQSNRQIVPKSIAVERKPLSLSFC